MEISTNYLKNVVETFIRIIEQDNISSASDLEKKLGKRYSIDGRPDDCVVIESRPSNLDTSAYTISYIVTNLGIPLEVKINEKLGYSKIIIKIAGIILGYLPFGRDIYIII